jgi:FkbM family methyltransferase
MIKSNLHFFINKLIIRVSEREFRGKYFLKRVLVKIRPKPTQNFLVKIRKNFYLYINPILDNGIEKKLFKRNVYEKGTLSLMEIMIKSDDVVLDVGANIGLTTIHMAKLVQEKGLVFAFEPIESTRKILLRNIDYNKCTNVSVLPYGLSDVNSSIIIYHNFFINRGAASIINKGSKNSSSERVKLFSLDRVIDKLNLQNIDFIKIDIEGSEYKMIQGALKTITKYEPIICLEYSVGNFTGTSPIEIYDLLKLQLNYKIYRHEFNKEHIGKLIEVKNSVELPKHDNIYLFKNKHISKIKKMYYKSNNPFLV